MRFKEFTVNIYAGLPLLGVESETRIPETVVAVDRRTTFGDVVHKYVRPKFSDNTGFVLLMRGHLYLLGRGKRARARVLRDGDAIYYVSAVTVCAGCEHCSGSGDDRVWVESLSDNVTVEESTEKTLVELAKSERHDDFVFLAMSTGVKRESVEDLWNGTRRRLGMAS